MIGYALPHGFEASGDVGALEVAASGLSGLVLWAIALIARGSAAPGPEIPDPGASILPWRGTAPSDGDRTEALTTVRQSALSIFTAVALIAVSCGGGGKDGTIQLGGKPANDHGTRGVLFGGSTSIEMTHDFSFSPTLVRWTVGSGGIKRFVFENRSGTTHNITLPARGVDQDLPSGEATELTWMIEPDQIPVVFWCKYHLDRGMVGAFEGLPG